MSDPNARRWCFTAWSLPTCTTLPDECRYIRWGEEICPTTGKIHWQGYLEFHKQKRIKWIRKWFLDYGVKDIKLIMANGNASQNDAYTGKDGKNVVTLGESAPQGRRSDLKGLALHIKQGDINGMRQGITDEFITGGLQAIKTAESLLKLFEQKRDWRPTVIVCHGSSGTGKSRWCRDNFPDAYWCGKTSKWWEGYDGHETVIIDDFRDTWADYDDLLRIVDCYPYRIENKGGSRQLLAKRIIFTSCFPPSKWYPHVRESKLQLERRLETIHDFDQGVPQLEVRGNIEVPKETSETPDFWQDLYQDIQDEKTDES